MVRYAFLSQLLTSGGDIVSGESYAVQSDHSCRIAVNDHEWAYVLYDLGHAAHHGAGADLYELVDTAHAADDRVVFHSDVAGCSGKAGHDDVVSEIAVVCHMGVCLKHIMRADTGFAVFSRSAVDGDEFAEAVVIADDDRTVFAGKFQILRIFSDDGVRIHMIVFPMRTFFEMTAWEPMMEPSPISQLGPMTA